MRRIGLALCLLLASFAMGQAADWRKAKWPFPRDAWPAGQAFSCHIHGCSGHELILTRVKFGFCNCEAGVRDDAEVDYVADVDLISQEFVPVRPGDLVELFGLKGRARLYHMSESQKSQLILGIALARTCDVVAFSISGLTSVEQSEHMLQLISQSPDIKTYLAHILGERLAP